MVEEIKVILNEINPMVDYGDYNHLIDSKILKSMDIMRFVAALCDEYDIDITVVDLKEENFNSVEAIASLVERLQEE